MSPIRPDKVVAVALEAQQWNVVLGALGEAPYRVAQPVIQAMMAQIQEIHAREEASQQANGADIHAPH